MKLVRLGGQFLLSVLPCLLVALITPINAKRDADLYCGACLALVDEMNYSIGAVDPKKKIQIGSFRVDPRGNQGLTDVQYARSDVHLTEVFETICEKMSNYAQVKGAPEDPKYYIRTTSLDGSPVATQSIEVSRDTKKSLQFACESIIEDHEEELMPLFKDKDIEDLQEKVCVKLTDLCPDDAVEKRLWKQARAVMDGMQEVEDRRKKEEADAAARAQLKEGDDDEDEDDDDDVNPDDVEGDVENYNPDEEAAAKEDKSEL